MSKKDRREPSPLSKINSPRQRRRDHSALPTTSAINTDRHSATPVDQRDAARKTALKIDAIEFEMSSELKRPPAVTQSVNGHQKPTSQLAGSTHTAASAQASGAIPLATNSLPTEAASSQELSDDFLSGNDNGMRKIALATSEAAQAIEEAAILFANEQNELVESMLTEAIDTAVPQGATPTAWGMLFDLYQMAGQQMAYENLAIRFASRFETSPPTWIARTGTQVIVPTVPARTRASIALSGKLDGTFQKQLDRVQKLGESNSLLQLDLTQVTAVTPEGCALLLTTLTTLREMACGISLIKATEFAQKIRSTVAVGRRDDSEAPWLLLLEILQLQGRQQDFEDTSIDYCVTFEVSPPAFIPSAATLADHETTASSAAVPVNMFRMPALILGKTDLVGNVLQFARQHNHAIFDCSDLVRVDFSAAGQLLAGLTPLARNDRIIEMRNVNQLVIALFNVMGLQAIVRILPRKE